MPKFEIFKDDRDNKPFREPTEEEKEEARELSKYIPELSGKKKEEAEKIREAHEELEEERGKHLDEMTPEAASSLVEDRIKGKEERLKKDIEEMTS